jgi:N-methylhydantoinase A/oxoprolinase/acetone carboxylase beta subunit
MKVDGPAIIVLLDTTIVVPKRFTLSIQEHDYYIMETL